MIRRDQIYNSLSVTDSLVIPEYSANMGFTQTKGDIFTTKNGATHDLYYNNGLLNVQLTNGPNVASQTLQQVLTVGNSTDGTDIVLTGDSNVVLPTVATNAVSGFLRVTNTPGIPTGTTGSTGGELAYDSVSNAMYIYTGSGTWQPIGSGPLTSLWEQAIDSSMVPVVRAISSVNDHVWIMGGAQNKNTIQNRFMWDPVGGSMCGGSSATGSEWNPFPLDTNNTMVFGDNHVLDSLGGLNINRSAMIGGFINIIAATINAVESSMILGGEQNVLENVTGSVVIAGNNNDMLFCNNCNMSGCAVCYFLGQQLQRSGAHACSQCTILATSPSANNQMLSSKQCDFLNTGGTNQCSAVASNLCTSIATTLTMYNNAFVSCSNSTFGGNGSATTTSAMIACDNCTINNSSHVNCAIIGGSGHIHTSTTQRSVILGGQNITCAESDAVYVPYLQVYNKLTINSAGNSFDRIGQATLGVGGTVTVGMKDIPVGAHIRVSRMSAGGVIGALYVSSISPGSPGSFTINSTSATDTSVVGWIILRQV